MSSTIWFFATHQKFHIKHWVGSPGESGNSPHAKWVLIAVSINNHEHGFLKAVNMNMVEQLATNARATAWVAMN